MAITGFKQFPGLAVYARMSRLYNIYSREDLIKQRLAERMESARERLEQLAKQLPEAKA